MEYVNALFENAEVQGLVDNKMDLVCDIAESTNAFAEYLKDFIVEHAEEFIEPTIDETRKNIRVFSEVAIAQYIQEQVGIYGHRAIDAHNYELVENSVHAYL